MFLPETPTVLVLLVATDGARWLPDTLRALRAQRYRPLKVIGVDNASGDGSGALLVKALGPQRVVTLDRRVGYGRALGAALKVASERGVDADTFLLLHDDAALAPDAVASLVEALRDDDVGIAGAKLVEWDDPQVLQDIGQSTDRYGRLVPRVERGELDQGQHDGTHDVLFATSAAMMVTREVVEKVGLFDPRYVVLRDDLDLCWRARIAGYRTTVTSAASARHASAGVRELRAGPPKGRVRYFGDRNMIATLIKNYGLARLAVALPLTLAISMAVALLYLVRGRRRSALQVLEALQWNVVHLPATVRARLRAQHARAAPDREVTKLMHHGATRLRAQLETVVERVVGEVEEGEEEETRARVPLRRRLRAHPGGLAIVAAFVGSLVAARGLVGAGALGGLDLSPFPSGSGDLLAEFTSGWRGAGHGGAGPATPGLILLAVLQFLCFGSGRLAQLVLILGLPAIGAAGVVRMARRAGVSDGASRVAACAYAASPLVLGTFGAGRLGDLALLAGTPWLFLPLARAAGLVADTGWRSAGFGTIALALSASLAPWSIPLVAGVAVVLAAFAAAVGKRTAGPVLVRAAAMVVGSLALLLPWSVELFRAGSAFGAGGADPAARALDLLGLSGAAVRPVPMPLTFGLAAAAVAGVLAAPEGRRRFAAALGALAFAGAAAAWGVGRGVPWMAARPAQPLAVTAVAVAALAAIAVDGAGPLLRTRTLGLAHVGWVLVLGALAVQLGAGAVWLGRGAPERVVASGELLPSFFVDEARTSGAFRIAWFGGTRDRPAVALTGPEGTTLRTYLARPAGAGARALQRTAAAIMGSPNAGGARMLATLGVRFVVVRPEASPGVRRALAGQVDLRLRQTFGGATVLENRVALPVAAAIGSRRWAAASRRDLPAAAGAGPDTGAGGGFREGPARVYTGRTAREPVAILLAEDHSDGWRADADGGTLRPERSFGWATRFSTEDAGARVVLSYGGQVRHRAALLGEAILALSFAAWWSRRSARERGER